MTLLQKGGSLSHFCVFKRSFYDLTEGINPYFAMTHDIDLYLKMEEVAGIGFLPKPLYLYRTHAAGISQGHNEARAFFWTILTRYEACKRRGIDPEKLLLPELQRTFGQIGLGGGTREILRVTAEFAKGKLRGLRNRLGR